MTESILGVKELNVRFKTRQGIVKAVDQVSFEVQRGEILGLVGESGCGKSVTARAIMKLIGTKKNELVDGEIWFHTENLIPKSDHAMQRIRGHKMAMIFQDPMTSLNPLYTVGDQIAEMPILHEGLPKKSAYQRAVTMLETVRIPSAVERARQYPHQFSGGMRQRAVIAMNLACKPELLIADEPTTALDVTIQAQIMQLLVEMREQFGAAIILITHDLGVVAQMCDRVAVMYTGNIIETASTEALFQEPLHPYTRGLLASLPQPGSREKLRPIEGQPPNLQDLP
ncbi:MAG: ABC transporter ATP-binding protein, partial [Candidatus Vecturithrix sp.]|nr:ABC transporter ATP-binding protein [Candidatus Vecturithrix sp.]